MNVRVAASPTHRRARPAARARSSRDTCTATAASTSPSCTAPKPARWCRRSSRRVRAARRRGRIQRAEPTCAGAFCGDARDSRRAARARRAACAGLGARQPRGAEPRRRSWHRQQHGMAAAPAALSYASPPGAGGWKRARERGAPDLRPTCAGKPHCGAEVCKGKLWQILSRSTGAFMCSPHDATMLSADSALHNRRRMCGASWGACCLQSALTSRPMRCAAKRVGFLHAPLTICALRAAFAFRPRMERGSVSI